MPETNILSIGIKGTHPHPKSIPPKVLACSDFSLMAQDLNLSEDFIKKCLIIIDKNPSLEQRADVGKINSLVAKNKLFERCIQLFEEIKKTPSENNQHEFKHSIIARHLNRALYYKYRSKGSECDARTSHIIRILLEGNNGDKLEGYSLPKLIEKLEEERIRFRSTLVKK